jgi:hypothetical protein
MLTLTILVLPLKQKGPQEELVLVDLDLSILEVRSFSPALRSTLAL